MYDCCWALGHAKLFLCIASTQTPQNYLPIRKTKTDNRLKNKHFGLTFGDLNFMAIDTLSREVSCHLCFISLLSWDLLFKGKNLLPLLDPIFWRVHRTLNKQEVTKVVLVKNDGKNLLFFFFRNDLQNSVDTKQRKKLVWPWNF